MVGVGVPRPRLQAPVPVAQDLTVTVIEVRHNVNTRTLHGTRRLSQPRRGRQRKPYPTTRTPDEHCQQPPRKVSGPSRQCGLTAQRAGFPAYLALLLPRLERGQLRLRGGVVVRCWDGSQMIQWTSAWNLDS